MQAVFWAFLFIACPWDRTPADGYVPNVPFREDVARLNSNLRAAGLAGFTPYPAYEYVFTRDAAGDVVVNKDGTIDVRKGKLLGTVVAADRFEETILTPDGRKLYRGRWQFNKE